MQVINSGSAVPTGNAQPSIRLEAPHMKLAAPFVHRRMHEDRRQLSCESMKHVSSHWLRSALSIA